MTHQFAEGPEDEVPEESTNAVNDEQGRSGTLQTTTRAQEQARSDGTANGDHLELAGTEALVETLILCGQEFLGIT